MHAISANKAKTHFGDMLLHAQREPVQINKHGKAVAVVVSAEEYKEIEALKLSLLKVRVQQARVDIKNEDLVDGEQFFDELDRE